MVPGPTLRCSVQTAGSGVIAKALPLQPHLLKRRRGQRINGGKHLHPTLPIGQNHLQLGLLQHHLGNPDAIKIKGRRCCGPAACRGEHPRLLSRIAASIDLPPAQQVLAIAGADPNDTHEYRLI